MARRKPPAKDDSKVQPRRPGMPSPDSVKEVIEKVGPSGRRFRILKTTERDIYDKPRGPQRARKRRPK